MAATIRNDAHKIDNPGQNKQTVHFMSEIT